MICEDYTDERDESQYIYLVNSEQIKTLNDLAPELKRATREEYTYQKVYSASTPSTQSPNPHDEREEILTLKNLTVDQLFEEIQARYTDEQANLLILELRNKLEAFEEQSVEINAPTIDTKWYDHLAIKDSLIKKGISDEHILSSVENSDELDQRLDEVKGANSFYVIPLNVNALEGSFTATNHWVGLYITTNEHGQIDSISYINPIGQKINEELQQKIFEKTKIEVIDLTVGKGTQFAYSEEFGIELKGNSNDCGPILVQLLFELVNNNKILIHSLNEEESIAYGQKCRAEQQCDKTISDQNKSSTGNTSEYLDLATQQNADQKIDVVYTDEHSTTTDLAGVDSKFFSDHM